MPLNGKRSLGTWSKVELGGFKMHLPARLAGQAGRLSGQIGGAICHGSVSGFAENLLRSEASG